jgi:5,10-methylenetetrahydromethanopterin reductase
VMYHAMYERGGAAAVDALPGGQSWREAIEAYPTDERHLAIHAGHLVQANPSDEPHVAGLVPMASSMALTGPAEQIAGKIAGLAALEVTEIVYQPAGSDIERELSAFASAAGLEG